MYSFSFTRFLSQRVFSSKVLMRHIVLYQWTLKGECYELMIVHLFDTFTHMIHYSLWSIFVLTKLICFLYELHIVSINRTLPVNNNTQILLPILLSLLSLLYYLLCLSVIRFALFYNIN